MSKIGVLAAVAAVMGLVAYAGAGTTTFVQPNQNGARSLLALLADSHGDFLTRHSENYVLEDTDVAACTLLKEQFADLSAKGHGEFRLMALTQEPIVEANLPATEFEGLAAEEFRAGKTQLQRSERDQQRHYLNAASAIMVTSQRCVLCHPNYKGWPQDQPVGALSYRLPID